MKKVLMTLIAISSILLMRGGLTLGNAYADSSASYDVNTSTPTPKSNCTDWMWQPDTSCYWRTCADDYGKQYCQECCKKKGEKCIAKKVKCQ